MAYRFFEKQVDGSLKELTLLGEKATDGESLIPLQVSKFPEPNPPQTPLAPGLDVVQPTRTTTVLSWIPTSFTGPPVTEWDVERRSSTDNGATFGSWAAISGSPFSAATVTTGESGLSTGTPEIVFQYRVRGVNADGDGAWSTTVAVQWSGTPLSAPARPTNLAVSNVSATSATLTWTNPTTGSPATKIGIFLGNATTPTKDNIDPNAVSYTWTGLQTGVPVQNVNVKRWNAAGWSSGSNWVTFTPRTPINFAPLIGCSNSDENHGGTNDWDSWRVYNFADALVLANRTGANHPKALALTDSGTSNRGAIYTSYNTAFNNWRDWLDEFYYSGDGSQTGQIMNAARADVELHIANGNEYGKDITAGNLAGFIDGCRGIYDATRILNPNGQRRYPLASTWLDPTHNQEGESVVVENGGTSSNTTITLKESIYPVVQYLDGVAWSMYPPGREQTVDVPTLDWPSFDPDLPYTLVNPADPRQGATVRSQRGWLTRCFVRTFEAQDPATNPYLTAFHPLRIAVWEIGIGAYTADQTMRPYYSVALIASMRRLCEQFSLDMATMHWWDQQLTDNGVPQSNNILSDETSPTGTQISTRVALQNWKQYSIWDGGIAPAAWNNNPKPIGNGTDGTTWKNRSQSWLTQWLNDMSS